ncbi:FR47-like protein [Pedobacter psychrotolerans]|uniref:FR47-like protein n=1 Tax=Pedobacter psychrotolerans TaxID=1843235 RepID=A0A4R2HEV0_9SPHI|nr:GNAT family N-acetyltransferase [Pedobacter psychrotolerans]TCO26971.1 FR47-like protein [Pedobacter psychrotolerans]GGE57956.1 GNAT family N-acetyltransferase [Pedobacter psychrotolerans]
MREEEKLDNPVWFSLTETHHNFALTYGDIKFYHPDYCPFGGFISQKDISDGTDQYANETADFYIVGEKPVLTEGLRLNKELICNQMVLTDKIQTEITEEIVQLNTDKKADLIELVNLVQPGYFKEKTPLLGNYYGIYKNNKLVAVTGERMKMNAYSEISAVVTHPDFTGKGYAKQLIAFTANHIFSEGKVPYLHVAETNIGAIKLYEKLGFETRRKISFWNLVKI